MIAFLVKLGLFSLFTASAVTVDPVPPSVVNAGVISTIVINETQKIISTNRANTILQTPFNFTSLGESFVSASNSNMTILGTYSLTSLHNEGVFSVIIGVDNQRKILPLPTLGPCAGNALTYEHQPVWQVIDFQFSDLTGSQLTFSISRTYQDAALTLEVPQWILFRPGMSSYYAISVPNRPNMALQIDIRRHNSLVPSPSKSFSYLSLATEQRCLNPTSVDRDPGIVESVDISIGNSDPDLISHVFSALIPSNSIVYVKLFQNQTASFGGLDFTYSISASIVTHSPSPPKLSDAAGIVLGVIFGLLIIVGGVFGFWYFKYTRRDRPYDPL